MKILDKNTRIGFRISNERKRKWQKEAKKEISSLTDFIFNKVEGNRPLNEIKHIENLFNQMVNDRRKVENNINQISRNINISKGVNENQMFAFLELFGEYSEVVMEQNKKIIKVFKILNRR